MHGRLAPIIWTWIIHVGSGQPTRRNSCFFLRRTLGCFKNSDHRPDRDDPKHRLVESLGGYHPESRRLNDQRGICLRLFLKKNTSH